MSIPSEGRLRVVIQPKPQSLLVGDALYLECGAVGKPLPHYQWYRNGAPLKNATKRKLNVRDEWRACTYSTYTGFLEVCGSIANVKHFCWVTYYTQCNAGSEGVQVLRYCMNRVYNFFFS